MASIHKEIVIEAPPEHVWAAVRDVGAVHQLLTPGILVDTHKDLTPIVNEVDPAVLSFAFAALAALS